MGEVDRLAKIFWEWHDQSKAPLEVRSYLRELAEYVATQTEEKKSMTQEDLSHPSPGEVGLSRVRPRLPACIKHSARRT